MSRYHYQRSGWTRKSFRDFMKSNYSLIDLILDIWMHKSSRNSRSMYDYARFSQRKQVRSRFI